MSRNIGWVTGLAVGGLLAAGSAAWAAAACCGGKTAEAPADGAKVAAPACCADAAACKAGDAAGKAEGAACKAEGGACKAGAAACKAAAPAVAAKPQTLCPVMNAPINNKLFVEAGGKRIYACCRGCIGKIQADPQKYIQQLEAQGVELEKVPAT